MVYHRHYIGEVVDPSTALSNSTIKDQHDLMSNTNLRYDIARLEAKLDIITNILLSNNPNSPQQITQSVSPSELALCRSMTEKQHVTAQLLIEGWANKDIAYILNIGENTVKLHVRAVCKKVGTKTRGQAAMVMRDIMDRITPEDYQRSSGGLPIDWGHNLKKGEPDPHAAIYLTTPISQEGIK